MAGMDNKAPRLQALLQNQHGNVKFLIPSVGNGPAMLQPGGSVSASEYW